MLKDYSNLMLLLTAFQSFFFFFFLITHKKGRLASNRILFAYLLALFLMLINNILFRFDLYLRLPHLVYQGSKLVYLIGPLIYFYTKSLTEKRFKLRLYNLFHLLPFLLFSVLMFFEYDIKSAEEKIRLLTTPETILHPVVSFSLLIAYYVQVFIYFMLSLNLLAKFRVRILQAYSSIEQINLSWLRFVLFGFIIIWIFDISMIAIDKLYPQRQNFHQYIEVASRTYTFFYILIFVYKGLKQPMLFHEFSESTEQVKYINSPLTEELKDSYLNKLTRYMSSQKPFLSSSININHVARELEVPSRYLSQVINEKLHKNFFDFINSYRIEEAKKLLAQNNSEKMTVLDILYDVGFNSKSSFNTAFKKHTQLTPSQYKNKHSRPSIS